MYFCAMDNLRLGFADIFVEYNLNSFNIRAIKLNNAEWKTVNKYKLIIYYVPENVIYIFG